MTYDYHPDPEIDAGIRADALAAEWADLKAGYPPRWWVCPECQHFHNRGFFPIASGSHRCLHCGYVGERGRMHINRPMGTA